MSRTSSFSKVACRMTTTILLSSSFASSFVLPLHSQRRRTPLRRGTNLFGLSEWRNNDSLSANPHGQRPILLLPFVVDEALLQGQSMDIRLKEGRFYDLFQDCMDDYDSIVGMALMGDDGLLDHMPLCEIRDFNVEAGFRGKVTVSVTLCAVGRANLEKCTQMKPIMMGLCTELVDDIDGNVDVGLANQLVNDIEATVVDMNLQQRYNRALLQLLASDEVPTTTSDSITTTHGQERRIDELTAASWACHACSDKSYLYKAISTTNLIERLELGLKALLDGKYKASSPVPDDSDSDVGFE